MSSQRFANETDLPIHAQVQETPVIYIRPSKGWMSLKLMELWKYRELLFFMIWRDKKIRYKQTLLGVLWAIIQPLMTMLVFNLVFSKLAKIPSEGIPYPLFCYVALVPWQFFASGLSKSSDSMVGNSHLITKVYFPRLVLPLSAVIGGVYDFFFSFLMLLGMMVYYQRLPGINVVWLPGLLILAMVSALGVGLWLSALNVRFRDVRYVVPFLVQFWLFATPIAYPSSLVSERWRVLYAMNPMAGVIEGFRWALLGSHFRPGPIILISSLVALVLLISGAFVFRRMERTFADEV